MHEQRTTAVWAIALAVAIAVPLPAMADGCFVSPETMDLEEPLQLGLLVHDGTTETLTLQVAFEERQDQKLDSFGWILALPSPPEASEASADIFSELMSFTRPYLDDDPFELSCGLGGDDEAAGEFFSPLSEIEVVSEQSVGAYDITTLDADTVAGIRAWIEDNGFAMVEDSSPIFQWYIDKGWYFVALRVSLAEGLVDGALTPITLAFETSTPVFPLKISSINGFTKGSIGPDEPLTEPSMSSGDGFEVLLYVVADTALVPEGRGDPVKMEELEFSASFAKGDLSSYPALAKIIGSGGAIAKYRFHMSYSTIEDDLYFVPDQHLALVTTPSGSARLLLGTSVVALLLAAGLLLMRRREG